MKILSLLLSMTILLAACGDDDDDNNDDNDDNDMGPGDGTIDISDPVAVASQITVENATIVTGNPPAPSTDANAPSIDEDDIADEVVTTQNGLVLIDIDVQSGDVAGTYVQIVGSDTYFDIPFNPNGRTLKAGRLLQDDEDPVVEIEIPENLGTGTFCADLCVYDSETRVSNVVRTCVEITELGGANSNFLTANSWEAVGFEEVDEDGIKEEYDVGELFVYEFTTSIQCPDGSFKDVTITESDRTDELTITFSENGAVTLNLSEFERDLNFETSDCENLNYIEEDFDVELTGTWSYNDITKELIVVLEVISSTFTEEIGDIEVITFQVEFDDATDTLRVTSGDDEDGQETIILEPIQ